MRWVTIGVSGVLVGLLASVARAEEKRSTEEQLIGGVISGLLGQPQQSPQSAYTAQERDRLVSLLQSGEYVTSRQGEAVDLIVYGVSLTHIDHVYTAKPIRPSQAPVWQDRR